MLFFNIFIKSEILKTMTRITRRNFINKSLMATTGAVMAGNNAGLLNSFFNTDQTDKKVFIPMPLQVVIDDVGWWSGEDGSKRQEPYRTGINRNHVPADYQAICNLGSGLGIRPQAAMILCEWDKENILGRVPSSTWMGKKWNNSKWVGPWMEEAAEIIRNNKNNFELTLHGVGHEYWENGTFTRAEWTDSKGIMRDPDEIEKHLDLYTALLRQHNLGSLPESFVPSAFRHCFGISEGRHISLAGILKKRGVRYINTPFRIMHNNKAVQNSLFGFDSGVITIDRGEDQFDWDVFPADPKAGIEGPTIGMHWPNMLHPDPERNNEIVQKWINYLKPVNEKPGMILATDSVNFRNQLIHNQLTKISLKEGTVEVDFKETDNLPERAGQNGITIKIQSNGHLNFKSETLRIRSESFIENNGFLYTVRAERQTQKTDCQIELIEG